MCCAGRILFTGAADEIHPDWFRNFGESDSDALQQASDACAGRCTVILTRNYFMNRVGGLAMELSSVMCSDCASVQPCLLAAQTALSEEQGCLPPPS